MYHDVSIEKYVDFELTKPEEGLEIPAGEVRTFLFKFTPNDDYFTDDIDHFVFLLPYLYYSDTNFDYKMPAVSQVLVVQPPFTDEYISELLKQNDDPLVT